MSGIPKAKLRVNKISIDMNPFVEEFVARTAVGMVTPLRGAENIQNLEIHQQKGDVKITINGNELPLTPFPNDIISNTLIGLVSSLKDIDIIDSIEISVTE